jgi:hypothetical protein
VVEALVWAGLSVATRKQRLRAEAAAANAGHPVAKPKLKPAKKQARGK